MYRSVSKIFTKGRPPKENGKKDDIVQKGGGVKIIIRLSKTTVLFFDLYCNKTLDNTRTT